MTLTSAERETIILMDDESNVARISTWQKPILTKLEKNPSAVKIVDYRPEGRTRGASFEIPANLITFRTRRRQTKPTPPKRRAR